MLTAGIVEDTTPDVALTFDEVYAAAFRKVYAWVRAHGCAEADVEDVTQDVFVIVQRKLPRFDGAHLMAWLYRITARTVRDHRRRAWFRHVFSRRAELDVDELVGERPSVVELIEQREGRHHLDRLLARMKPQLRVAFVLFEIEGVNGEEIAALEGISIGALWTRLHRARKQFEAIVADQLREGGA